MDMHGDIMGYDEMHEGVLKIGEPVSIQKSSNFR